ncbi:hypothetical protein CAPN006_07260 [Capnocytophaga canimorsus]|nr:hypothetical protein CAPN006_07260 [Capnocytophaga canimorsus]
MLRSFHEEGGINAFDTISGYLLAGMPAFDTLTYYLEEQIGSYTFRFIYAVANVLGANYQLTHAILPYTYTPVTTNVYTVMFPFYKDFGYIGVGFFSFIYGAIYTFIYRKGGKNAQFFVLLYAMFFPYILLQFMGEFIFTVFSSHLQSVIFLLIPYFLKFKR